MAPKVVFSSTSEVYGHSAQLPFEEDGERLLGSTRIDRWCYATSKQAGEHFCFAWHRRGLPVVLRYFNVYGPPTPRDPGGDAAGHRRGILSLFCRSSS